MQLTFHGAAGGVTGSCTLVQTERARVLIDCGMFQGGAAAEALNRRPLPFDPATLDAVILTHAHLDHSGRLPLLTRRGFRGRIWCTPPTIALTEILLRDSAYLQVEQSTRCLRRRTRGGRPLQTRCIDPLYTDEDVSATLRRLASCAYGKTQEVAPGVSMRFVDAGHILGSASLMLTLSDKGQTRNVHFSADIGENGSPLLPDPHPLPDADAIILESTYGDRDHRPLDETLVQFRSVIDQARKSGGKILIPTFAIGRTQSLIYHLSQMHHRGELNGMPVFVDSPMAVDATRLYQSHRELFDDESKAAMAFGCNPLTFPSLRLTRTGDESRAINNISGPAIIMAPAGMCTGGRILHHLRHGLYKPQNHVIIAGFQSHGSLGRRLVEGAAQVRIMGEVIAVRASIHTMGGFSAHAGRTSLIAWARAASAGRMPRHWFLNHGEDRPRQALADAISRTLGVAPQLPMLGQTFTLD